MRHVEQKHVRFTAAGDADACRQFPDLFRSRAEHLVSPAASAEGVDQVKAVDVKRDRVHIRVRVVEVVALAVLLKIIARIKSCQGVGLGGADDAAVLGELDRSADARKDDLRHVVGLRDEVRGAGSQAAHLGGLVRSQHDDRYAAELVVRLDDVQQLKAVHHRHEQIQQDQRYGFGLPANGFQRSLAVFGIEHLVFAADDLAEYAAVDQFVLHDQDGSFVDNGHGVFLSCQNSHPQE